MYFADGNKDVLPTHVGVILLDHTKITHLQRTTHTRGGDPEDALEFIQQYLYYPHTLSLIHI